MPAPLQPEIINRFGNCFLLQDTTFGLVHGLAPRVGALPPTVGAWLVVAASGKLPPGLLLVKVTKVENIF